VAGEAGDALEARAAIKALNPDVITLDVEMPKMNGLSSRQDHAVAACSVFIGSSVTASGASAAIKALEIGAFDCVAKPGPGRGNVFRPGIDDKSPAAADRWTRFAAAHRSAGSCQNFIARCG